jgi:hypothetical protein
VLIKALQGLYHVPIPGLCATFHDDCDFHIKTPPDLISLFSILISKKGKEKTALVSKVNVFGRLTVYDAHSKLPGKQLC